MLAISLGDPGLMTSDEEAKAQAKAWAIYVKSIPDRQKPEWIKIVEKNAPFFTALGTSLAIYVPKAFVHFKKRWQVAQAFAAHRAAAQRQAPIPPGANGAAQSSAPANDWSTGSSGIPSGF